MDQMFNEAWRIERDFLYVKCQRRQPRSAEEKICRLSSLSRSQERPQLFVQEHARRIGVGARVYRWR